MRSIKWLLAAGLIVTMSACTVPYGNPSTAHSGGDFGDYGYSNLYRYYAGPAADYDPPHAHN
jgi:hypothetical protein